MGAKTARPPILLEVDGVTLPGEFVWTRDNRGHGGCGTCQAWPGSPCNFTAMRLGQLAKVFLPEDEPFVHVGRR